jgi:hypothetical protein
MDGGATWLDSNLISRYDRPERWLNKEKSPVLEPVGGVWGNMFSFIGEIKDDRLLTIL